MKNRISKSPEKSFTADGISRLQDQALQRPLLQVPRFCAYCGEPAHTPKGDTCPQYDKERNR